MIKKLLLSSVFLSFFCFSQRAAFANPIRLREALRAEANTLPLMASEVEDSLLEQSIEKLTSEINRLLEEENALTSAHSTEQERKQLLAQFKLKVSRESYLVQSQILSQNYKALTPTESIQLILIDLVNIYSTVLQEILQSQSATEKAALTQEALYILTQIYLVVGKNIGSLRDIQLKQVALSGSLFAGALLGTALTSAQATEPKLASALFLGSSLFYFFYQIKSGWNPEQILPRFLIPGVQKTSQKRTLQYLFETYLPTEFSSQLWSWIQRPENRNSPVAAYFSQQIESGFVDSLKLHKKNEFVKADSLERFSLELLRKTSGLQLTEIVRLHCQDALRL